MDLYSNLTMKITMDITLNMPSTDSESDEEIPYSYFEPKILPGSERCTARKSTTPLPLKLGQPGPSSLPSPPGASSQPSLPGPSSQPTPPKKHTQCRSSRRRAAKKAAKTLQPVSDTSNEFIANFNPQTSVRQKKKLHQKMNPGMAKVRHPPGALYDENGVHISTLSDLCDCLNEECAGCFFACHKCGSPKCGIECRVHRTYVVESMEYEGDDDVVKNPVQRRY